ncbi:hypothetical protein Tsubulata_021042, partial [Turnera subulata]
GRENSMLFHFPGQQQKSTQNQQQANPGFMSDAMDASCSRSSDADPAPSGPTNSLANLPSRGIFPSTIITSSNPGQLIKTNQTNILIRSLQIRRQKSDSTSKDLKGATGTESSRKRSAGKDELVARLRSANG